MNIKLSEIEARILRCTELRADMSIENIRKETGYREHTIRHSMKRLREREIVRLLPFINLHVLGYVLHNIFFSLENRKQNIRGAFIKELLAMKKIMWVAELGGDFQYGIEIAAQNFFEVRDVLNTLSEKFGNIFLGKSVASQFSVTLLSRGYISDEKSLASPLSMDHCGTTVIIDELDHKILAALTSMPEESHREIVRRTQIPLATFERRIKKLRESQVLLGYFYVVNPAQFSAQSFKIVVFGKGISRTFSKMLLLFAANHPNIVSFIQSFGSWDYEIGIEVFKPQDAMRICNEIYEKFGDSINALKILPKFRDLKNQLYPS